MTQALAMDHAGPLSRGQAFDKRTFRRALGHFPTGVGVMACRTDGGIAAVTANSFASVSLNPPLVLWSLAKSSRSFEAFVDTHYFSINLLGAQQVDLANHFASSADDKAAAAKWWHDRGAAPVLHDVVAYFQCAVAARHNAGDHVVMIGEVLEFHATERVPLVFAMGRFVALPAQLTEAFG